MYMYNCIYTMVCIFIHDRKTLLLAVVVYFAVVQEGNKRPFNTNGRQVYASGQQQQSVATSVLVPLIERTNLCFEQQYSTLAPLRLFLCASFAAIKTQMSHAN